MAQLSCSVCLQSFILFCLWLISHENRRYAKIIVFVLLRLISSDPMPHPRLPPPKKNHLLQFVWQLCINQRQMEEWTTKKNMFSGCYKLQLLINFKILQCNVTVPIRRVKRVSSEDPKTFFQNYIIIFLLLRSIFLQSNIIIQQNFRLFSFMMKLRSPYMVLIKWPQHWAIPH